MSATVEKGQLEAGKAPVAPQVVTMEGGEGVIANKTFIGEQHQDNKLCSTILDPLVCFNTCVIVPERENIVELWFGAYKGTITEPGFYCRNGCFVELRKVSTALQTIDLPNIKVIDVRGAPLIVSGIVTFEVVDARKAAIDVVDAFKYVSDIAPAILKRTVAQFPYDSRSDDPAEKSLRADTDDIGGVMRDALQARCNIAGVRIENFAINELSYAPEISQAMLKRQQADALVDARRSIVAGAKDIALSAIDDMGDRMSEEAKGKLLGNLLVVLVGDQDVTPTLAV